MNLIGEVAIPESTSSSFHFNKSHVLFGRLRPYLRKVLVPDFTGQCSTEIFCIKPEDNVIREFLAYWLLEQKISSKIEATSTGARMPRANMNALLEFDFPIPSIKEQKKITSKLDLTFAKISKAKNTLAKSKYNYFCLKSAILSQELQSSEAA
jgi:type I restriction enzyme S subunit